MIRAPACDACGDQLLLDESYAVRDGFGEGELRRWRCGACGDRVEDVLPLDEGSAARVA